MSNLPQTSQELPLDDKRSNTDDLIRGTVDDDDGVVGIVSGDHGGELRAPGLFPYIWCLGEDGENSEMAAFVI